MSNEKVSDKVRIRQLEDSLKFYKQAIKEYRDIVKVYEEALGLKRKNQEE